MRKLRRLLLKLLGFGLLLLIGILLFNTFTFPSKQLEVEAHSPRAVPQNLIEHLQEAVRIPTISDPSQMDSSVFYQFNDWLKISFPLVDSLLAHQVVNEFSHLYHWQGKDTNLEPILLMAHLDVVPIEEETKDQWKEAPFAGLIKDGNLWGRGTLDDKLNVVGILEAVELMLEHRYRPERSVYLAFGHDEEIGGRSGAVAMAKILEAQGLQFAFALDEGMIILEKAFPDLEAPAALIGIAEKGYASIELFADVGQGGHSSMPPPGGTAIGLLSKAIADLEANPFEASIDGIAGMTFDHIGPELPFVQKMVFANRWLFGGIIKGQLSKAKTTNALIRTTTAPTIINAGVKDNVLPSQASAVINFRIVPGEDVTSVIEKIKLVIDEERIDVRPMDQLFSSNPSKISPAEGFGFNILATTIKENFPETMIAPTLVIAGTDSRHYGAVCDNIYRFMPVQLKNSDLASIHGINEKISVEAYEKLVQFYMRLLENGTR